MEYLESNGSGVVRGRGNGRQTAEKLEFVTSSGLERQRPAVHFTSSTRDEWGWLESDKDLIDGFVACGGMETYSCV